MQTYLVTWSSPDADTQFRAGKHFVKWFESGGADKNPSGFERLAWCSMMQNGSGLSIIRANSMEIIWEVYGKWRKLGLTIDIEPVASMKEASEWFKKMQ